MYSKYIKLFKLVVILILFIVINGVITYNPTINDEMDDRIKESAQRLIDELDTNELTLDYLEDQVKSVCADKHQKYQCLILDMTLQKVVQILNQRIVF
ncbi:unnamed protein product [Oppiella nova]|uniref:Uncharacterized protein n=1 Tax=Oppiella nova TaxID=334625 RepID=A0A7R9LZX8_9ACAR|nr:unnamed protein product [Oppiella nova]CAG2168540.1 unnamed protein product [Oppiella nova]